MPGLSMKEVGTELYHHRTEHPKHPDVLGQNMGMYWDKTSGCFGVKHGDVLDNNIPMLWILTIRV